MVWREIQTEDHLRWLEHGKKEPGLRTVEILAPCFEMTPAQLLRGIGERSLLGHVNLPRLESIRQLEEYALEIRLFYRPF